MAKKFTDLSQLTKAVLDRGEPKSKAVEPVSAFGVIPHPRKPVPHGDGPDAEPGMTRDEIECLAYFSHTSLNDPRFATSGRARTPSNGKAERPASGVSAENRRTSTDGRGECAADIAKLEKALAASEARALAAERALTECRAEAEAETARRIRLEAEVKGLRARLSALAEAKADVSATVRVVVSPPPPAAVPDGGAAAGTRGALTGGTSEDRAERGVLKVPGDFDEAFPGEVREMTVAALRDACETARQSARERRSAVLDAVLRANPPSGELERRRLALRQIMKDAAHFNDANTLKELGKLGLKLVSGRKHWKLEYGNVRMPMSKTPSDYRSGLNSSAEMANRCF